MRADLHPKETERLAALRRYDILDTPGEPAYDEVVKLVASFCGVPIAMVSLVDEDRQWFKAAVGTGGMSETPRDMSLCAHAILQPGLLVVPDTREDPRFRDNPLVTGERQIRFYAGAILKTSDGYPLGTLCVLDTKPRQLTEEQKQLLTVLSHQVMGQLELRRALKLERRGREEAEQRAAAFAANIREKDALLEQKNMLFREIDHRVKNSLQMVSAFLSLQARAAGSPEVKEQLREAQRRIGAIANVHEQLHRSGEIGAIEIAGFLKRLCAALMETAPSSIRSIEVEAESCLVSPDIAVSLGIIVNELAANAFKHAYPDGMRGPVWVRFARLDGSGRMSVSDEGVGVPTDFSFDRLTGLGVRVMKAMAQKLNGSLQALPDRPGAAFAVTFPLEDAREAEAEMRAA